MAGIFTMMCELEPLEGSNGTRVIWRMSGNGTKERLALRLLWRAFRKDLSDGMHTIERHAAELEASQL